MDLEKSLYYATKKIGVFGCFEVTIGFGGKERVDYMTYDTKGIWRCYEIKVSKADFKSKSKTTFVGNYNYYVLTSELYDQVKDDIPPGIGVYINGNLVKRASLKKLAVPKEVLYDSFIRSLYREVDKTMFSLSGQQISTLNRELAKVKSSERKLKLELATLKAKMKRDKQGGRL